MRHCKVACKPFTRGQYLPGRTFPGTIELYLSMAISST